MKARKTKKVKKNTDRQTDRGEQRRVVVGRRKKNISTKGK